MPAYSRNHYVPEWYQKRFLSDAMLEKKFFYLDLKPERITRNGKTYIRKDLLRWGPNRCFLEDNLYTTSFGDWESTEIEERFFGKIDSEGKTAVEFFSSFRFDQGNPHDAFHALLPYMSVQKLRTPKGLGHLSKTVNIDNKNIVLMAIQKFQNLFCALWTECVWSIADASNSDIKFIVSDHPVTVFNKGCFPASKWCRGTGDADIRFTGTHTIFPLSYEILLILTNLSWVRNPYENPLKIRPHPNMLRPAMFSFLDIQTGRMLSSEEVNQINYIIKNRAYRYIAAAEREWLYPEKIGNIPRWDKLGDSYLLMPDPREVTFSNEVIIGYKGGAVDAFDEYGRKPWHKDYNDKMRSNKEWNCFHAFQGEYARKFGPRKRGCSSHYGRQDEYDHDYHMDMVRSEQTYKKECLGRKKKI